MFNIIKTPRNYSTRELLHNSNVAFHCSVSHWRPYWEVSCSEEVFCRPSTAPVDKYDSVNKRTQEVSKLMKLHIQGVWQNAGEFIMPLTHCYQAVSLATSSTCMKKVRSSVIFLNWAECGHQSVSFNSPVEAHEYLLCICIPIHVRQ